MYSKHVEQLYRQVVSFNWNHPNLVTSQCFRLDYEECKNVIQAGTEIHYNLGMLHAWGSPIRYRGLLEVRHACSFW